MLATPTTTRKELTLGMTTVQMAARKSSEPFHLPEDLSLPKPKSFMWVSAAILPAHPQKESGVRGYDTAPWTGIRATSRTREADDPLGKPGSLRHQAKDRRPGDKNIRSSWCHFQSPTAFFSCPYSQLLPNAFFLATTRSPLSWFCPRCLSTLCSKSLSFPPHIILVPQELFSFWKPKHWHAWSLEKGTWKCWASLPSVRTACSRPHPTSCVRRPEIKFKSSFPMVVKFYKMLQRIEFRWCNHFIFSTVYF